jgi:hypothetical protein
MSAQAKKFCNGKKHSTTKAGQLYHIKGTGSQKSWFVCDECAKGRTNLIPVTTDKIIPLRRPQGDIPPSAA